MKTLCAILLLFLLAACHKEKNDPVFDCNNLKQALLEQNNEIVEEELMKLLPVLAPHTSSTDVYGHEANLNFVVGAINQCRELSADLLCYNCIKTYPPQSEIRIQIQNQGQQISRIVDIQISDTGGLEFSKTHE